MVRKAENVGYQYVNFFFAHNVTKGCIHRNYQNIEMFVSVNSSCIDPLPILTYQKQTAFKKIVIFSQRCFLLNQKIISLFVNISDIISLFAAELEEPKIGM